MGWTSCCRAKCHSIIIPSMMIRSEQGKGDISILVLVLSYGMRKEKYLRNAIKPSTEHPAVPSCTYHPSAPSYI